MATTPNAPAYDWRLGKQPEMKSVKMQAKPNTDIVAKRKKNDRNNKVR